MATNPLNPLAPSKAPPKRILPIGIQSFPDIRERGFVYVDKTARAYELITGSGKAFFLSRPRRFGKSLLSSTFGAIFEGRRELFGEIAGRPALAIDSLDWEWKRHPVIRIDLGSGNYGLGVKRLQSILCDELRRESKKYGITLDQAAAPASRFKDLIEEACEKIGEKAVVLIDEYDSPLTSTLTKRDVHIELREALKEFYSVLKSYDSYLRFVFITGVSKFSQVSLFSGMNQLKDLTFDPRCADICGLTQEEVIAEFGPEIDGILESTGRNRDEYTEQLRVYYNGYRFSKAPVTVYSPFGLLNHFDGGGEFSDHWYETGTPSFLVELINKRKINIADLNDAPQVREVDFGKYDIDNMALAPLMCQTGYLTITGYDAKLQRFTLDYPNEEVRASFSGSLVKHCLGVPPNRGEAFYMKLTDALYAGDVDAALGAIKLFLAEIPYDLVLDKEAHFQSLLRVIFRMLGFDCRTEERIATGRIDMLVTTPDFVYCFEFKLNGSAEKALAQIDTKEYAFPWTGSGKKVFKVGVSFDKKKRNIGKWVTAVIECK